jgi:hypothetical protein
MSSYAGAQPKGVNDGRRITRRRTRRTQPASPALPLGEAGERLHDWIVALRAWRAPHGLEGGDVDASSAVVEEAQANIGAEIMAVKFGGGPGPWGEETWPGWWGEDPPFHMPVFVLTHHEREPLTLSDTTFTSSPTGSRRRSSRPAPPPARRMS